MKTFEEQIAELKIELAEDREELRKENIPWYREKRLLRDIRLIREAIARLEAAIKANATVEENGDAKKISAVIETLKAEQDQTDDPEYKLYLHKQITEIIEKHPKQSKRTPNHKSAKPPPKPLKPYGGGKSAK